MRHTSIILLVLAALLCGMFSCQGCKEDVPEPCDDPGNPQCPNYDPCHGRRTPVSAAFELFRHFPAAIITNWFPSRNLPLQDTAFANSNILFSAMDSTAGTYEWRVGTDSRTWHTKQFNLIFECDVLYTTIPIRLITTRLQDTVCLDGRPLSDTLIRNLYFIDRSEAAFYGTFRGQLNKYINQQYNVTIRVDIQSCLVFTDVLFFDNLTNENCSRSSGSFMHNTTDLYVPLAHLPFNTGNACGILLGEDFETEFIRNIHVSLSGPDKRDIKISFTYVATKRNPEFFSIEEELEFTGVRID